MTFEEFESDILSFSRDIDQQRSRSVSRPSPQVQVETVILTGKAAEQFGNKPFYTNGSLVDMTTLKTPTSNAL